MEPQSLLGSSVMVDGYVGTLRYLIEPGMTIVEIWVNEGKLTLRPHQTCMVKLMWRKRISFDMRRINCFEMI